LVRVNLINPESLADQHLVAEYDEILMLLGYVRRYPKVKPGEIPKEYRLGPGHIKFFKDKILYLKKRHELLKKEMVRRGFKPKRTIRLADFNKRLANDWQPQKKDFEVIRQRLVEKISKKPRHYRHYGEYKGKDFLIRLVRKG
jgi:deoxyribonuclease (pyrimidine dimer)